MTADDWVLLLSGIAFGANLTNLTHMYWAYRDGRRSEAASRHRVRILAADNYLGSLHRYQRQHRGQA
ncbi:hypothetical protein [Streptomyces sp. NPDC020607]|uniref:hypothetical protein n=1 Tax=Streptomyces sp. NPDC020607 TaxID=3365082 RepID=UPI0037936C01